MRLSLLLPVVEPEPVLAGGERDRGHVVCAGAELWGGSVGADRLRGLDEKSHGESVITSHRRACSGDETGALPGRLSHPSFGSGCDGCEMQRQMVADWNYGGCDHGDGAQHRSTEWRRCPNSASLVGADCGNRGCP